MYNKSYIIRFLIKIKNLKCSKKYKIVGIWVLQNIIKYKTVLFVNNNIFMCKL